MTGPVNIPMNGYGPLVNNLVSHA